ncbi:MAG TPA: hypothetical protein PJ989_02495 [Oligoflexia bacterium]|nr:hypothetical protein [Oligoflexia bacterium]
MSSFITRRFRNSQLCYANNKKLQKRVLGSLGKYLHKYGAEIYAYTMFGSHDHPMIEFAPKTKSSFFKDFGARTAEAVKKNVPSFGTGPVMESRPREQAITEDSESHLDRLMYTVMQPILAGLCKNLSDYPGFNSWQYIISGKPLHVEFFKGSEFRRAKRRNPNADPAKYTEQYQIIFKRLSGYEDMSQSEYRNMLLNEYERRRKEIIEEFEEKGHIWPSVESLRRTKSTETARNPKRSGRYSKRPLVLSLCMERKQAFLDYYFSILEKFKKASTAYMLGDRTVKFPEGTCAPPVIC